MCHFWAKPGRKGFKTGLNAESWEKREREEKRAENTSCYSCPNPVNEPLWKSETAQNGQKRRQEWSLFDPFWHFSHLLSESGLKQAFFLKTVDHRFVNPWKQRFPMKTGLNAPRMSRNSRKVTKSHHIWPLFSCCMTLFWRFCHFKARW